MSKLPLEEIQSLRSRIYHGEQELISTLTPEQFLALLSYDYDTGFASGKASAQVGIRAQLVRDGAGRSVPGQHARLGREHGQPL